METKESYSLIITINILRNILFFLNHSLVLVVSNPWKICSIENDCIGSLTGKSPVLSLIIHHFDTHNWYKGGHFRYFWRRIIIGGAKSVQLQVKIQVKIFK